MSSVKACDMKLVDYDISPKIGFLLEDPLMSELDDNQLISYKELRLAHTQLSCIGSGYIWQNGPTGTPDMIPRCLAVPWYNVSKKICLNPILHYPSLILNNYTIINPDKPFSVQQIRLQGFKEFNVNPTRIHPIPQSFFLRLT
ncbi:hypothetical protein LOTGIDRAFT_168388 [Lottia gigantea]|uniref:Uncharacterized protein n=1 Tax=Lottia gigantea TaxID=225164 RepID=V4B7V1_LOTGI|nr:hypothetical protein LOTGIDRAFT_168388 [Lottia gigantea]ESO84724.1 hypothetical protein LOTGIDRAFT_168388 [Lottia gigantea]